MKFFRNSKSKFSIHPKKSFYRKFKYLLVFKDWSKIWGPMRRSPTNPHRTFALNLSWKFLATVVCGFSSAQRWWSLWTFEKPYRVNWYSSADRINWFRLRCSMIYWENSSRCPLSSGSKCWTFKRWYGCNPSFESTHRTSLLEVPVRCAISRVLIRGFSRTIRLIFLWGPLSLDQSSCRNLVLVLA